MKKLFLFTALLCAATLSINADLLNGPYSPESQELVQLAQSPDMQIPDKFKDKKEYIAELRNFVSSKTTENFLTYHGNIPSSKQLEIYKNFPKNIKEAIIQLIKLKFTNQDEQAQALFVFGLNNENEDLIKSIVDKASLKQKNIFL